MPGKETIGQSDKFIKYDDVETDCRVQVWPLNFDGHFLSVVQTRPIDLTERCSSDWLSINLGISFVKVVTQLGLDAREASAVGNAGT